MSRLGLVGSDMFGRGWAVKVRLGKFSLVKVSQGGLGWVR